MRKSKVKKVNDLPHVQVGQEGEEPKSKQGSELRLPDI
jgi:hypothetical protein